MLARSRSLALGSLLCAPLLWLPAAVGAQDTDEVAEADGTSTAEPADAELSDAPLEAESTDIAASDTDQAGEDSVQGPRDTPSLDEMPASPADDDAQDPTPEPGSSAEDGDPPPADDEFGIRGIAELGFVGVLDHTIRLGGDGTDIDYINDGNQNNLYFFARLTLELDVWRQHHIRFLYQPLEINTQATLRRDLLIDGLTFPEGTPVIFRYGFPFYRVSWDFDVLDDPREQLRFGLGLQIRNATIQFESLDGELYRSRNDIGPVPLLRVAFRFPIVDDFWFAFEADGFYAPISVLNGSDTDVQGAILDTSLQIGWRFMEHVEAFLNIRYLGGGASGAGDPTSTSDGEQANWLHFLSLSVGATIDSRP